MKLSEFCKIVGTSEELIRSKSREQSLVNLRQIYCFVCREYYNIELKNIGDRINRTHATVIHSVNKIKDLISIKDKETIKTIEYLRYKVKF